jgi:hypothetical protein
MSTIQIEVPLEALSRPGVAQALSDLALSLGGQQAAILGRQRAIAPADPVGDGPTRAAPVRGNGRRRAVEAPPEPARGNGRRRATGNGPRAAGNGPRAAANGPRDAQWDAYLEALPETSRRFLSLLEQKGKLTVSEAVDALGLDSPKAMGGLTGAMRRWAPKQGVDLPFEAGETPDGQRCWVWTGRQVS